MHSQKEAVYVAVKDILEANGKSIKTTEPVALSISERAAVVQYIADLIASSQAYFSPNAAAKYSTEKDIKKYVSGLVSNWLRRDPRLNGGSASAVASQSESKKEPDTVLKNLKNLLHNVKGNPEAEAEILKEIEKRSAGIKADKIAGKIDKDSIPEHLKHLL